MAALAIVPLVHSIQLPDTLAALIATLPSSSAGTVLIIPN